MSQQLYTFQYRKPRHSNPTFISSHVSSTLSFYNSNKIPSYDIGSKQQTQFGRYASVQGKGQMRQSKSDFLLLPKASNIQSKDKVSSLGVKNSSEEQKIDTRRQGRESLNNLGQYGQNLINPTNYDPNPPNPAQKIYNRLSSLQTFNKPTNNLIPYNSSSLQKAFMNFNEKDIFMKQGHNYNIITYQPKQHNEHIKKYPKLSLEEKDQYFRVKYMSDPKFVNGAQDLITRDNPESYVSEGLSKNQRQNRKQTQKQKMAGLHTYRMDGGRRNSTPITHIEQNNKIVSQGLDAPNTRIPQEKAKLNPRSSKFDMKLLSNMDEFNYYA